MGSPDEGLLSCIESLRWWDIVRGLCQCPGQGRLLPVAVRVADACAIGVDVERATDVWILFVTLFVIVTAVEHVASAHELARARLYLDGEARDRSDRR